MDEMALWREFKERGCERAREELILAHLGYVALTLKRSLPNIPARIDREDLEAEGRFAVVRAVDRFSLERGVKFTSFLIATIRGAFLEHLRQESWAPRSAYRNQKQTGELLIEAVSLEVVQQAEEAGERKGTVGALISPEPEPTDVAIRALHAAVVRRALRRLDVHERAVILLHFYHSTSLEQIAVRYGWTAVRTGHIKKHALVALRRSALVAWEEADPESNPPAIAAGAPLTEREARASSLYHGRNMTKPQVQREMGIGANYLRRLLRQVRAKQAAP